MSESLTLEVKPDLTDGELTAWAKGLRFDDDQPIAVLRSQLFHGAVKAGIIKSCSDDLSKPDQLPARRVQQYGAQLLKVYREYTSIDPL